MVRAFFAVLLIGASIGAAAPDSAYAQEPGYPWCAMGPERHSFRNCGYPTFEACLASVRGVGGNCQPNPAYRGPPDSERWRSRDDRRRY